MGRIVAGNKAEKKQQETIKIAVRMMKGKGKKKPRTVGTSLFQEINNALIKARKNSRCKQASKLELEAKIRLTKRVNHSL